LIKIYFNQKPLFLTSFITRELELYYGKDGTAFSNETDPDALREVINSLRYQDLLTGILQHDNEEELLSLVKQQFNVVQAAGGLVYNAAAGFLFIYRRGKWDLPKGKLDEGENLEECALREVQEETGAKGLTSKGTLLRTYHNYTENETDILKETHWFLMEAEAATDLVPQTNEDIEECVWVHPDNMNQYVKNTHPSVLDVLDKGMSALGI
jgi:8-oxo-dGTP pyrophosphatase MutT (NUDIX family)